MFLLSGAAGLLGGGGAAAGAAATAATTAAGAASTGLSISSILQGVASVGGLVASISAGNAEAANLRAQARDAERQKPFEVLQSVDRKRSLLKAAGETLGQIDTAYAGSGVDLSFGSANQARKEVYRETDLGLTTDSATTSMRINRLTEQAGNFRMMAKRAKLSGVIGGFSSLFRTGASLVEQAI